MTLMNILEPLGLFYYILVASYHVCLLVKGKMVDGRAMMVQFAKYGPNAERM